MVLGGFGKAVVVLKDSTMWSGNFGVFFWSEVGVFKSEVPEDLGF